MSVDFADIVLAALERRASDIHLTAGAPPNVRLRGRLMALEGFPVLGVPDTREIVYSIMSDVQRQQFETLHQVDFSYSIPRTARMRVNAYLQRGAVSAAFRVIPGKADSLERLRLAGGKAVELDELMARCDVVVATTAQPGLIRPEQVRPGQIIFAISNPLPEIEPQRAMEAGAALAVDGSVVNNLLGFPGLYRGALDSRATRFNTEMFVAAALAIAGQAHDPEVVPDSLDRAVHKAVAQAVARAALDTGVARDEPSPDYFEGD